jgi:hypothetical protein
MVRHICIRFTPRVEVLSPLYARIAALRRQLEQAFPGAGVLLTPTESESESRDVLAQLAADTPQEYDDARRTIEALLLS